MFANAAFCDVTNFQFNKYDNSVTSEICLCLRLNGLVRLFLWFNINIKIEIARNICAFSSIFIKS